MATGFQPPSPAPSGCFQHGGSPMGTNKSVKLAFGAKTPKTAGKGKSEKLDRFIPNRSGTDLDTASFNLTCKENAGGDCSGDGCSSPSGGAGREDYQRMLASSLNMDVASRILAFKHKAPAPPEAHDGGLKSLYSQNLGPAPAKKASRHIPTSQERILDAPELLDDYYLNLLDWSCNNVIAVALGRSVYLWNSASGSVQELCQCAGEADYVSSLAWGADGNFLAVGTSDAKVQIWDAERQKQIRELAGHTNRVSAVAWNGSILSSGGRDSVVNNWDVRKRRDEACVASLTCHEQEICGLKWSPCGQQLASGANDNHLAIHDAQFRLQHKVAAHTAAVKALAWCPFQSNLLASGGGTGDRHIRFWNTHTGAQLSAIDTGSQVCSLQWNRHEREILSSHGYSKNQLCLWKYPSLVKVAEMTGHTGRVLHMATSPDGSSVVSAGADETLRFWRVFGEPAVAKDEKPVSHAGASVGGAIGGLRSIR